MTLPCIKMYHGGPECNTITAGLQHSLLVQEKEPMRFFGYR